MEVRRLGVALLAAGSSKRFGVADKLTAHFQGRMLAEHAANAIPVETFEKAWVVVAALGHPCEPTWRGCGFEPLVNSRASEGMGTSVALAARAAMGSSLDALLIVLADMPYVPLTHFEALIREYNDGNAIAVSEAAGTRMPPAIFAKPHFEALAALGGDKGARTLLAKGKVVACSSEWLRDIDRVEDL
ncbi:MAG: nucleotidyltransferase family protein [Pseudomonadota bacterium]